MVKGGIQVGQSLVPQRLARRIFIWIAIMAITVIGVSSTSSFASPQVQTLSLEAAMDLALANHPSIEKAALGRLSKELAVDKRLTTYGPRLSTSIRPVSLVVKDNETTFEVGDSLFLKADIQGLHGWSMSASNRIQTGSSEKTGISLEARLTLWPLSKHTADYLGLMEAKELVSIAAKQEIDGGKAALIDVYRRYRSLQINQARLAIHAAEYDVKEVAYSRALAKAEQGHASPVEVLKAEQEKAESEAIYGRALRDYQREWQAFLLELSLDDDEWQLEELSSEPAVLPLGLTPEDILDRTINNSIVIHEANQAVLAAKRKAEAVQASHGIELNLEGRARLLEENTSGPGWEAYMSFAYPLLDGAKRRLELEEAEIAVKQAENELVDDQRQLSLDVQKKLSDLEWLEAQAHIARTYHARMKLEHKAKWQQAADGLIAQRDAEVSQWALEQAWLDWHEAALAYEVARLELMVLAGEAIDVEGGSAL